MQFLKCSIWFCLCRAAPGPFKPDHGPGRRIKGSITDRAGSLEDNRGSNPQGSRADNPAALLHTKTHGNPHGPIEKRAALTPGQGPGNYQPGQSPRGCSIKKLSVRENPARPIWTKVPFSENQKSEGRGQRKPRQVWQKSFEILRPILALTKTASKKTALPRIRGSIPKIKQVPAPES